MWESEQKWPNSSQGGNLLGAEGRDSETIELGRRETGQRFYMQANSEMSRS